MSEHIIVGVDGSGPSRAALRWALHRATDLGSEVVLAHVVDDEGQRTGSSPLSSEAGEDERVLAEASETALRALPAERLASVMPQGNPAWSLAGLGQPGDVVAVGSHKTGFLRGRALGTRGIVVASAADCSVAVIPEDNLMGRRGVVVGVDHGEPSLAAVAEAAREAARLHQELTLVHATPASTVDDGRRVLATAAATAASTSPTITIRTRLSQRRTSEGLLDASHNAALLVLGRRRPETGQARFIGPVTHEVLLNLNCPVMITG